VICGYSLHDCVINHVYNKGVARSRCYIVRTMDGMLDRPTFSFVKGNPERHDPDSPQKTCANVERSHVQILNRLVEAVLTQFVCPGLGAIPARLGPQVQVLMMIEINM
jgi:hypothetical protein